MTMHSLSRTRDYLCTHLVSHVILFVLDESAALLSLLPEKGITGVRKPQLSQIKLNRAGLSLILSSRAGRPYRLLVEAEAVHFVKLHVMFSRSD